MCSIAQKFMARVRAADQWSGILSLVDFKSFSKIFPET